MTVLLNNKRERERFVRFAFVGVIGAIIDFGIANLLVNVFNAPLVLAGTISFICAVTSNFTWNRYWVYPDSRSKPIARQLMMFFVVNAMGLLIRVPVLKYLEPVMERLAEALGLGFAPFITSKMVGDNLTLAIAVIIVMFWNFFVNRYWTYNDVD